MEHNVHVVDGISMEEPGGSPPPTLHNIEDLFNTIDKLTRNELFEAAAREDEDNA